MEFLFAIIANQRGRIEVFPTEDANLEFTQISTIQDDLIPTLAEEERIIQRFPIAATRWRKHGSMVLFVTNRRVVIIRRSKFGLFQSIRHMEVSLESITGTSQARGFCFARTPAILAGLFSIVAVATDILLRESERVLYRYSLLNAPLLSTTCWILLGLAFLAFCFSFQPCCQLLIHSRNMHAAVGLSLNVGDNLWFGPQGDDVFIRMEPSKDIQRTLQGFSACILNAQRSGMLKH